MRKVVTSAVMNVRATQRGEPLAISKGAGPDKIFVPGKGEVPEMNWRYRIKARLTTVKIPISNENQNSRLFLSRIRILPIANVAPLSIRPDPAGLPSGCTVFLSADEYERRTGAVRIVPASGHQPVHL